MRRIGWVRSTAHTFRHATLHLGQELTAFATLPDGRLQLTTSAGTQFTARALFIAAGIGAFQPRRLRIEGIDAFEGSALHYHAPEPASVAGKPDYQTKLSKAAEHMPMTAAILASGIVANKKIES